MDADEELIGEDDSVFDNIVNDTLNESSDAIFEDSFSSVINSTPEVDRQKSSRGRGRGRGCGRGRGRLLSVAADLPSTPPRLPRVPGSCPSPVISGAGLFVAQQKPARLKFPECPSTLANERTYAVHKKLYGLKRAMSRISSVEDFDQFMETLLITTLAQLIEEVCISGFSRQVKDFAVSVKESFTNRYEEEQDILLKFARDNLMCIVTNHKSVFSSSLSTVFYLKFNELLNNVDFMNQLSKYFLGLVDLEDPKSDVVNVFVGNFMHKLCCVMLTFFIKKIHGSTASDEIPRKRGKDKTDSENFLQLCYHIGGSVVAGFIFKGNKYKENNTKWGEFVDLLITKFVRVDASGNACAESVRHHTEAKDRGGLTHISQEALDFFVVLFDLLMSLEQNDGSLTKDVVDNYVVVDSSLVCLWDVLVGSELDEDSSLDFMMQVSETCSLIVIKGIMNRRLNDRLKKAYSAVPLRSRLAN